MTATHLSEPLSTMTEVDVPARGVRLTVCVWGPADGPVVVCCHGWLDQGAAWEGVARSLVARGYRVLAPDHRGHGRSAWTPPGTTYHFMEYVADLDAVVHDLQLGRIVLVGHSMGGTIASMYAGLRPERVRGLVLLDGLGPPAVSTPDAIDQAVAFLNHHRRPPEQRPMTSISEAAARIQRTNPHLAEPLALALARRCTTVQGGDLVWRWDPLHRTRAAVAYDEARHLEILQRVKARVAVGVGGDGWYAHLPGLQNRIKKLQRAIIVQELACGHDLHHAFPETVAEWVDAVSDGM
jgi:pimeloyl-ACP methyl ester carboxylesterase